MMRDIIKTVNWLLRLTVRFLKGAPAATTLVILLSLLMQALTMTAFLLPIKVIMILSSPEIPSFFPDAYSQVDRDTLVISLGVIALTCFLLIFLVKRGIKFVSQLGVNGLQEDAQKITLFPNQNTIASNAYLKYSELLANLAFSLLAIAGLFYLYTDVATLLLIYLALSFALLPFVANFSPSLQRLLTTQSHTVTGNINNVGFFVIFIFVVIDFLYDTPPSFFIAMLSMIIIRRLLSSLAASINKAVSLQKQKQKINAIFFHHKPFALSAKTETESFWTLFDHGLTNNWLKEMISQVTEDESRLSSVNWLQTQETYQLVLNVSLTNQARSFLVKLFDKKFTHLATHEASLIEQCPSSLPCPPLLLVTTVSGYPCHLFDITGLETTTKEKIKEQTICLQKQLLNIPPPPQLLQQYKRSKRTLWQRLDASMLDALSVVANLDQVRLIAQAKRAFPDFKNRIKLLPFTISMPSEKARRGLLLESAAKVTYTASWESWTIEPIGYGWKTNDMSLESLEEELTQVYNSSPLLSNIPFENIMLASLLAEFEKKINLVQYYDAISLLGQALSVIKTSRT